MLFIRTCSQSIFLCTFARSQLRSLSTTGRLISQADVSSTQTEASPPQLSQSLPLMTSRKLEKVPAFIPAKQAWLETLSVPENKKLGIVDLHPSIFGVFPRVDILWRNIYWQRMYKHIDYTFRRRRSEMPGTNKKPWPQKGTGRARHGNRKSPLWHTGGKATGPRGPKSYFYMLSKNERVRGLQTALTVKYAQDNLHIVDSLDIPTDNPEYLQDLVESRGWGLSVLFIDDTDFMPRNITLATSKIKPYNLMPAYGLNVYSMLKHENLVLTLAALEKIENKMLQALHSPDYREKKFSKVSS